MSPSEWIHEFRHQSVLRLALLATITNGLYLAFWFSRQSRVLSRAGLRETIEPAWRVTMWVISGLSAGWIVIESVAGASPTLCVLGMIVDNLAALVFVTLAFKLRTHLNVLVRAANDGRRSTSPFSWLGTFTFNVLYLQWKINHLQQQMRPHCCQACGYDLRGLTLARCPECGTQFDPLLLSNMPHATARPADLTSIASQ